MKWLGRFTGALLFGALVAVGVAAPAGASLTGGCHASGRQLQTGKSYDAVTTNSVKIPRTGDVKWKGSVPVPATKRLAVGEVQVKFPWPVGDVEIGHWGKDGKRTGSNANTGTYHYDFPQLIAGVKTLVHGRDKEPNGVLCQGSVVVEIAGTSPLAWASLALTVVMVLNLSLTIRAKKGRTMKYRGRPILAAISGFFAGFFVALDLVFFGAIRLDNLALTVLPILGLTVGIMLALWAPLGRSRRAGHHD